MIPEMCDKCITYANFMLLGSLSIIVAGYSGYCYTLAIRGRKLSFRNSTSFIYSPSVVAVNDTAAAGRSPTYSTWLGRARMLEKGCPIGLHGWIGIIALDSVQGGHSSDV